MSAYIIGQMKIFNDAWKDEYFSKVPALIEQHGGRFLVKGGNAVKLEGPSSLSDASFVLEFGTKENALAFWNSSEFAPLVELRQSGSELNAMLVEGV